MSKITQPKARLDALDGWRAVAVLLVVLTHLINVSAVSRQIPEHLQIVGAFGGLGVRIFFIISGYVICLTLQQEHEKNGRMSLTAFYIRRFFRILPPLWCYLLLVVWLCHTHVLQSPPIDGIKAAAFVCNIPSIDCAWDFAHTWTLAYEEQFYVLFPLCLVLLSPRKRRVFLGLLVGASVFIVLCYWAKHNILAGYLTPFQFLLTGAVFGLFSNIIRSWLARSPAALIYGCAILMFGLYHLPANPTATVLNLFVVPPMIGIVLLYTSYFPCAAKTILSLPVVRFVGRISYGVYLWQQLATGYYRDAGAAFYSASLCLMAVVCVSSFFLIEQPLIKLAARLSKRQIEKELVGPPLSPARLLGEEVGS